MIWNFKIETNRIVVVLLTLFLSVGYTAAAINQNHVVVTNASENAAAPVIKVKWFSPQVYYDNGVHVYRRETGTVAWTKISNEVLKKGMVLPTESDYAADKTLKKYIESVNKIAREKIKGLIMINMILKAIQSPPYARYLGIEFDDNSIIAGKSYEYQVKILGTEAALATSNSITAGVYQPEAAPKNIVVTPLEFKAHFAWEIEEERYYAVNVYRSQSAQNTNEIKLNRDPIVLSKVKDEKGQMSWPKYFFEDDSLKTGVPYYYRISALDFFGREGARSASMEVIPPDLTPPPSPEKIKITAKDLTFTLSWKQRKVADLKGFDVYRTKTEKTPYEKVNKNIISPADTMYVDVVALPGNYYYYVTSVDNSGNNAKTATVSEMARDNVPPATPKNIKAVVEAGQVKLTWDANTESDLKGYLIMEGLHKEKKPHFNLVNKDPLKKPEFIDRKAKNVKNEFMYKVVAVDTNYNRSKESEIIYAKLPDIIAPDKPYIKSIGMHDDVCIVEWLPDLAPDLKEYNLFRSSAKDSAAYKKVNNAPISKNMSKFADRTLESEIKYFYYLTATDSAGNQSAPSHVFYLTDHTAKDKIQGIKKVTAKYSKLDNKVELKWDEITSEDLIGYTVFRKSETEDFMPITGMIRDNTYSDKVLKDKEKVYYYEVREYWKHGHISISEIVKVEHK